MIRSSPTSTAWQWRHDEVDDGAADELLESGRLIDVDPIDSSEGFRWMERFATSQSDPHVRERLLDALGRPRPFRRFRDALHEFPRCAMPGIATKTKN